MSSEPSPKPTAPDNDVVAEVDELVEEIKAIHAARGRMIAKNIKRRRKGRSELTELDSLGFAIPPALRALYWNWNGAERGGRMSFMEASVFFNYMWFPADFLVDGYRISKLEKSSHWNESIGFLNGWRMQQLGIFPALAEDGDTPLVATEPWSKRLYFAFDGIVPMLRSVIAAEKAGAISYASERITDQDGKIIVEANEIQYDPAALWEIIAPHNPRTAGEEHNYWRAIATDTLEFDGTPPDKIEMKPEVQEIVFREVIKQKKKWDKELQKKLSDE